MKKALIILVSAIPLIIIVSFYVYKEKRFNRQLMRQYNKIEEQIKKNNEKIDSLYHDNASRRDTIRLIEKRQNIYTTKNIYNEKVILTSNDSINDAMRKQNQREFIKRWMSGRYTPTKNK